MYRTITLSLAVAMLVGSVVRAEEATKEKTLQAWAFFVGHWKTAGPDGTGGEYWCEKTKSGSYLFHSDQLSLIVGWDNGDDSCKSVGLNQEGHVHDTWKLVGEGPEFEGHTKDGDKLSIECTSRNRYVLMIGSEKTIGERIQ